jgi:UDP-N-acetylmuramate--alanine ligase
MYELDELLKTKKRIHFIGIGGSGMCPLAEILHTWGYELSGSDNNEGDTLNRIKALGIPVTMGQKAGNIGDAEIVIHTAAILPDNPELVEAKKRVPTFERRYLLGAISRMYKNCIGVCGTHGKTTTTSMLTQIMVMAGMDPSAVIGGKLPLINANGIAGKSENFVCEACEFKNTFLETSPAVAVLLNVDDDHLDFFKTMDNLIASFREYCEKASRAVIYNGDDENTLKAVKGIENKKMISFGFDEKNDYYAKDVVMNERACAEFDVYNKGEKLGGIHLSIPGKHNALNALAAITAAIESGVSFGECVKPVESFGGAGRRFEVYGTFKGITVADDYAHHPTELEATLKTAVQMNYNSVWAVFQPFTFSRTYELMDDFARVLKIPQHVVMTEIMGSREINTYGVYTSQLAEKIPGSVWFNTFDEVVDYVIENAKEGDLVITLGCGDIYKAAKKMVEKLK